MQILYILFEGTPQFIDPMALLKKTCNLDFVYREKYTCVIRNVKHSLSKRGGSREVPKGLLNFIKRNKSSPSCT